MNKEFPVISYDLKDKDPMLFSKSLGDSFKKIGFCSISDHPIDTNLINQAINSFSSFFELPEEIKRRYLLKGQGGARGYTPFKIETAKDSNLPEEVRIGAIVRKNKVMMPKSNFIFEKDDIVIVLSKREQLKEVEDIFRITS